MTASVRPLFQRLAAIEAPILALVVASALASERLLPVALILAALFWPVRWLANRRLSVRTAADWPIGVLIALVPVTLWATALPAVTRVQVFRLLVGIALCYALVNWASTPARLRLAMNGLLLAGLGLALAGPLIGGLPPARMPGFIAALASRLPGAVNVAVNPNVLAGALAVLVPLPLGLLLYAWGSLGRFERPLAAAAALALLGMAAPTGSRGAWLGIAAALGVLFALRWRWGWVGLPLAALAGGLAAWQIGLAGIAGKVMSSGALGGLDARVEVWSRALYMIQDFPFTGIGMGTFRQVANLLYPFFLAGPDAEIPHAHNLFLQVAVDLGLPGLIAWLALFGLVCAAAWRVYRCGRTSAPPLSVPASPRLPVSPSPYLAGLGAGLLASQATLAVHGLTDAVTWGTRPAVLVWAIWGLALAAARLAETSDGEPDPPMPS